jgi:hypothetical protein
MKEEFQMKSKPMLLIILALFTVVVLARFMMSPTAELARTVDLVTLFSAGVTTGVLLVVAIAASRGSASRG